MTRSEIVTLLAERCGISQRECDELLRNFTDIIADALARGEKITISGFGTFERKRRKQSFARNPATGRKIYVPAQNIASFRAGTGLKDAVKT